MTQMATILDRKGYTLRSGGADGADSAFERGASKKEIYLPWKRFNNNGSDLYDCYNESHRKIAEKFHPRWKFLKQGAKKMMVRNSAQIYGLNCSNPKERSKFVICWTSDGKASGGTGQAIRVAESEDIPILNIKNYPNILELDADELLDFILSFWDKYSIS